VVISWCGGGRDDGRKNRGVTVAARAMAGDISIHGSCGCEMHLDVLELQPVMVELARIMIVGRSGFRVPSSSLRELSY
jgi:hypothetical protein